MYDFFDLDAQLRANKAALLIAVARFDQQLAPFVKNSATRLAYVSDEIDRLCAECAAETGAEVDYVRSRLDSVLNERVAERGHPKLSDPPLGEGTVLDKKPKQEKLPEGDGFQTFEQGEGLPPARDGGEDDSAHKDDVNNTGEVDGAGLDEALKPDVKQDLGDSSGEEKLATLPGQQPAPFQPDTSGDVCPTCGTPYVIDQATGKKVCPNCVKNQALVQQQQTQGVMPVSCFRCEADMDEARAKVSKVCEQCSAELVALASRREAAEPFAEEMNQDPFAQQEDLSAPENPSQAFQCKICAERGQTYEGSRDQVLQHLRDAHADELGLSQAVDPYGQGQQQAQQPSQQTFLGSMEKEADPAQQAEYEQGQQQGEDPHENLPVDTDPSDQTPADRFDNIIQDLANRAAARQFSMPTDDEVHQLASQLGLPEDQVRQSLFCRSDFGGYEAANGTLGNADVPEGYEEVTVNNLGGHIDSHEALVPVQMVISKVADEMGMEPNLVYTQVRDRYGDDLPEKYHASVAGEHHFYLPSTLMAQAQPQQQQSPDGAPPAPTPEELAAQNPYNQQQDDDQYQQQYQQ